MPFCPATPAEVWSGSCDSRFQQNMAIGHTVNLVSTVLSFYISVHSQPKDRNWAFTTPTVLFSSSGSYWYNNLLLWVLHLVLHSLTQPWLFGILLGTGSQDQSSSGHIQCSQTHCLGRMEHQHKARPKELIQELKFECHEWMAVGTEKGKLIWLMEDDGHGWSPVQPVQKNCCAWH